MNLPRTESFEYKYTAKYRSGVCRDRVFLDVIFDDTRPLGRNLTFLDIGCGRGFDNDVPLQQSVARAAGQFIGVEPDPAVTPGSYFHCVHRCLFEHAPLAADSIDVAYAIMVLEHVAQPQLFFDKLWRVLRKGGVFWGLTVDRRHWFCRCSLWLGRLGIKEFYLNRLLGRRGQDRYENYPVYYRSNSPQQIEAAALQFARRDYMNLSRVGQCDGYFPPLLWPLLNRWDAHRLRKNRPGTLLVVRLEK